MNAAIIAIGDELLIGQVINTNASKLGEWLTKLGYNISEVRTIGDNKNLCLEAIKHFSNFCDVVIITGGLGPTHDDITKFVICDLLDCELTNFQPQLDFIIQRLHERKILLNERNRNQAMIPSKSVGLINNFGTAAGILFKYNKASFYALPGVPSEMEGIFKEHIEPQLNSENNQFEITTFVLAGIAESILADKLIACEGLINANVSLAYLPNYSVIRLRVMRKKSDEESKNRFNKICEIIKDVAAEFIISEQDKPLLELVAEKLRSKNLTISTVESCTGGMIATELTNVAGSSYFFIGGIVAYSNQVKVNELQLPKNIIENYGAVSQQTAELLALQGIKKFNTDICLSATGIAGPTGGTEEKPVGTVFIAITSKHGTSVQKYSFGKGRNSVRQRTVLTAMSLILNEVEKF